MVIIFRANFGDKKISSLSELHPDDQGFDAHAVDAGLSTLLNEDSEFSLPIFKDFCFSLYSTLHHARGGGSSTLSPYMAYLSDDSFRQLLNIQGEQHHLVIGVVIGSFEISAIEFSEKQVEIKFLVDANYTEEWEDGVQKSFYSREIWTLSRNRGVKSRGPKGKQQIQCPACGSPAKSDLHGVCSACHQLIRSGIYDWFVQKVNVLEMSSRPPLLTTTVEEEGNNLPTIYDSRLAELEVQAKAALNIPDFSLMNQRVQNIFLQLQKCWSLRDLRMLRPFESDSLYETHQYWIEEYKKQKLINRLDNIKIYKVDLCKLFLDAHYISATVRIYASLNDWTESEEGKLICGSKTSPREFTEYWTLIRSLNFKETKGGFNDCPACGAPLKVNQAGDCEYCLSKVTSGEFDWVLSSIEQDEAYLG